MLYIDPIYFEKLSVAKDSEVTFMAIAIVFLPAVLSIIGFCLALASRGKIKNGSNTAGLVLNIITIILCVAEYLMITG